MEFDYFVTYNVDCLDRNLIVCWNADGNTYEVERRTESGACITYQEIVCEDMVYRILDERYGKWNNPDLYPDEYDFIHDSCCEEFMLMGLDEIGLKYTPIYIGN